MRLEITQKADLAVRAVAVLQTTGSTSKGADLARVLDSSAGLVAHALNRLVKAGWVDSSPGPTGGYTLRADPASLSVLDVVVAIEGPTDNGRCVARKNACDAAMPCLAHTAWTRVRQELDRSLAAVSLASLATQVSTQDAAGGGHRDVV